MQDLYLAARFVLVSVFSSCKQHNMYHPTYSRGLPTENVRSKAAASRATTRVT